MVDWKAVASSTPYHLATEMEYCPFDKFWVVLLTSEEGETCEVYQNEPDANIDPANPWLRLRKFCEDHPQLRIVNMAYVNKLAGVDGQINLRPNAKGYFYAKRMRRLFNAGPYNFTDEAQGVGFLDEDNITLNIQWVFPDGRMEAEQRPLIVDEKQAEPKGLIRN